MMVTGVVHLVAAVKEKCLSAFENSEPGKKAATFFAVEDFERRDDSFLTD